MPPAPPRCRRGRRLPARCGRASPAAPRPPPPAASATATAGPAPRCPPPACTPAHTPPHTTLSLLCYLLPTAASQATQVHTTLPNAASPAQPTLRASTCAPSSRARAPSRCRCAAASAASTLARLAPRPSASSPNSCTAAASPPNRACALRRSASAARSCSCSWLSLRVARVQAGSARLEKCASLGLAALKAESAQTWQLRESKAACGCQDIGMQAAGPWQRVWRCVRALRPHWLSTACAAATALFSASASRCSAASLPASCGPRRAKTATQATTLGGSKRATDVQQRIGASTAGVAGCALGSCACAEGLGCCAGAGLLTPGGSAAAQKKHPHLHRRRPHPLQITRPPAPHAMPSAAARLRRAAGRRSNRGQLTCCSVAAMSFSSAL